MNSNYLESLQKQFTYYKSLGDKTFAQLSFDELQWQPGDENSIAIITKHIAGNMLSRWTNFKTEDGEKPWRNRDQEFLDTFTSKEDLIAYWEEGWYCLFSAIKDTQPNQLENLIYIRNQGHTILEAFNRQLAHYSYHIGQIVFLGKMIKGEQWQSLSIPKGASKNYNKEKFSKEKDKRHFTDDL
jgi:hypothetical protein